LNIRTCFSNRKLTSRITDIYVNFDSVTSLIGNKIPQSIVITSRISEMCLLNLPGVRINGPVCKRLRFHTFTLEVNGVEFFFRKINSSACQEIPRIL
jgi:hypothetical protein